MKNFYLTILIAVFLTSCNNSDNGLKQADFDKLNAELAVCKKTNEELSNTPQMRISAGQKFQDENNFAEAKKVFNELIEKYPGSSDAKTAATHLTDIEDLEMKQKEAEEKKRTLGFKAIKESTTIKIGVVIIKFNSVTTVNQWNFDDYGSEYRLRKAERGDIYVNAKVSISADSKNPSLPPICVYKISNGSLTLLGTMEYRFARWEDYGTYLGNNADYGNDFAHTKSISFSCGLSISETDIDDEAVFVVVKNVNCFLRSEGRFDNPPVSYVESNCNAKSSLTINDFDKDYLLVKVFNRNKL